jgi:predicted 2-oxoglutarate/Fe(II)-dependent dioxygenase YbiX
MHSIVHKHDIIEIQDFFTKEECENLISYYESAPEEWQLTCFYNARVMDPHAPHRKNPSLDINQEYFNKLRARLHQAAEESLGIKLKNLTLSAHKWLVGSFASYHADNAELDGTLNAWQDNKVVTILYLNDNYDGGVLDFRDHDLKIAPKQGTLMVFDVGINNVHAVSKVTSGERYTMLLSWDYADSVYPEGFLERLKAEKMAVRPMQEKQRENWMRGKQVEL